MYLDRGGLRDQVDGDMSFLDVVYFTMVTVTTVGYGDIVPVSDRARVLDAVVVSPIRIFVWFISSSDLPVRTKWAGRARRSPTV